VGLFVPRVIQSEKMKKTTKTTKTPAPATKLTAPAPARKSTVAPKIKAPAAPQPDAPAPAPVTKPKGGRITIIANVDIGFGNSLYVRGDEPFLHWAKGTALGNVAGNKWEIVLTGIDRPFEFKFLLNDSDWSKGGNYTVSPGDTVTLTPAF
jgi:hypothetical protein